MAAAEPDILAKLDEKEKIVFKLMVENLRTSEISKMLSLSYHDAAEICKMVKEKLAVTTLSELKNLAVQIELQKKTHS